MPVSNGQIGRYDIRRGAVVETALQDNIISTGKVQDLAISLEKISDYSETDVQFGQAHNVTLDDSGYLNQVSVDIDVPTWAGFCAITSTFNVQVSGTGGDFLLVANVTFNDPAAPAAGGYSESMFNGESHQLTRTDGFFLAAPGSTVTVYGWARVGSGSSPQNSNIWSLSTFTLFKR